MKEATFWFVVVSETEAAEHGLVCGAGTDLPLSEAGMKSAAQVAGALAKKKISFKVILSSPALRAVQMADFIHDKISCKFRVIQELSGRHMGRWEGERIESIAGYSLLSDKVPEGEGLADFRQRVGSILKWLESQPQPAIVVADEAFGRVLLSLTGVADRELKTSEIIEISLIE
jgi:broad specificity phosphatase PhoE